MQGEILPVGPAEIEIPKNLGWAQTWRAVRAVKTYRSAYSSWDGERNACLERLQLAKTFGGESSTQIMLKPGESVFAFVTGASLIEDRRGPGQWKGRSRGVSVPIGLGIRYRTGSSRGHYVQGAPIATAIDTGTLYFTNQRVVFQGAKQTRECRFDKLIGFQHTPDGSMIFSVSNRQKPTRILYGPKLSGWVDFRLDLALAHYQNSVPELISQIERDLAMIDSAKPTPPAFDAKAEQSSPLPEGPREPRLPFPKPPHEPRA